MEIEVLQDFWQNLVSKFHFFEPEFNPTHNDLTYQNLLLYTKKDRLAFKNLLIKSYKNALNDRPDIIRKLPDQFWQSYGQGLDLRDNASIALQSDQFVNSQGQVMNSPFIVEEKVHNGIIIPSGVQTDAAQKRNDMDQIISTWKSLSIKEWVQFLSINDLPLRDLAVLWGFGLEVNATNPEVSYQTKKLLGRIQSRSYDSTFDTNIAKDLPAESVSYYEFTHKDSKTRKSTRQLYNDILKFARLGGFANKIQNIERATKDLNARAFGAQGNNYDPWTISIGFNLHYHMSSEKPKSVVFWRSLNLFLLLKRVVAGNYADLIQTRTKAGEIYSTDLHTRGLLRVIGLPVEKEYSRGEIRSHFGELDQELEFMRQLNEAENDQARYILEQEIYVLLQELIDQKFDVKNPRFRNTEGLTDLTLALEKHKTRLTPKKVKALFKGSGLDFLDFLYEKPIDEYSAKKLKKFLRKKLIASGLSRASAEFFADQIAIRGQKKNELHKILIIDLLRHIKNQEDMSFEKIIKFFDKNKLYSVLPFEFPYYVQRYIENIAAGGGPNYFDTNKACREILSISSNRYHHLGREY